MGTKKIQELKVCLSTHPTIHPILKLITHLAVHNIFLYLANISHLVKETSHFEVLYI